MKLDDRRGKKLALSRDLDLLGVVVQAYLGSKIFVSKVIFGFGGEKNAKVSVLSYQASK